MGNRWIPAAALAAAAAAAFLLFRPQPVFNGSRTGSDSQFRMEFTVMNTTDSQRLELEAGDVLRADIVSRGGRLDVSIRREGGPVLYEGARLTTGSFELPVEESGIYVVAVTGSRARGSVSFVRQAG